MAVHDTAKKNSLSEQLCVWILNKQQRHSGVQPIMGRKHLETHSARLVLLSKYEEWVTGHNESKRCLYYFI